MRAKELLYLVAFVLVITAAIGSTLWQQKSESASTIAGNKTAQPQIIQLSEKGREKAATMVLLNAPPMQPATHIDRWNPELHHESCFACHGKEGTGALIPTSGHFYDNDPKGTVFRDNCIQCHAQQNDTKTAFNE